MLLFHLLLARAPSQFINATLNPININCTMLRSFEGACSSFLNDSVNKHDRDQENLKYRSDLSLRLISTVHHGERRGRGGRGGRFSEMMASASVSGDAAPLCRRAPQTKAVVADLIKSLQSRVSMKGGSDSSSVSGVSTLHLRSST